MLTRAGIGFRVRTGYATAVVLAGTPGAPELVLRQDVLLANLEDDDSRQPYHAGLERGEQVGLKVVRQARRDAERRAAEALARLAAARPQRTARLSSIGLVVGSDVDPQSLGNLHIRAHALEGRFYREVLEAAAAGLGLRSILLLEREAFEKTGKLLTRTQAQLKHTLARTRKVAGPPWRRNEQLAMLAAWVALGS
jgi:hypothetical protein